ncbi:MAG: hypothetical protein AB7E98_24970 [Pirellulales bacterium]
MSTDVRDLHTFAHHVGSPREIAATAAKEFAQAHFCRRHPILSFVVLPIVALPLLWALSIAGFVALVSLMGYLQGEQAGGDFRWAGPTLPLIVCAMVLTPIMAATWFFCRLARKSQVNWKWTLAACLLLAVLSGPAMIDVGIRGPYTRGVLHGTKFGGPTPPEQHGRGFLSFGLGLNAHPSLAQIAQFALPLTIAAWAISRQLNQRRRSALAG